mmetsp:Transcript_32072/g.32705  ORF Transcript_32072/g.32705 Transcript_32072/m.32705 type:complete len:207 (+) Transcript_32072:209-829(+)
MRAIDFTKPALFSGEIPEREFGHGRFGIQAPLPIKMHTWPSSNRLPNTATKRISLCLISRDCRGDSDISAFTMNPCYISQRDTAFNERNIGKSRNDSDFKLVTYHANNNAKPMDSSIPNKISTNSSMAFSDQDNIAVEKMSTEVQYESCSEMKSKVDAGCTITATGYSNKCPRSRLDRRRKTTSISSQLYTAVRGDHFNLAIEPLP